MDDVCANLININNFNMVFNYKDKWDSVSFNRDDYYDIWALSLDDYIISCQHWNNWINVCEMMKNYVISKLENKNDNEFIPVYSAFNGLAIYKLEKFINCKYNVDFNNNLAYFSKEQISKIEKQFEKNIKYDLRVDCEHRSFHLEAIDKNNAKIMISPLELFDNTITYNTKYGLITLYRNEVYIGDKFKNNEYWDDDTLVKLKKYINKNKNILEIGGHCGTSSIIYASYLNDGYKVYVFEPQKKLYKLLLKNIKQNRLENKIIPFNKGIFCYNGYTFMNNIDLDGGGGNVIKRYTEEFDKPCNFGGICIGGNGEQIEVITIDELNIDNIGFIHCDAQGSENFIFSKAIKTITTNRPVIYYEDNQKYAFNLYNNVCINNPNYTNDSLFNITKYCIEILNYKNVIEKFNDSIDTLLFP